MKKNYTWMALFKKVILFVFLIALCLDCYCWGFYAHRKINYYAVFLLPSEMLAFYKKNIEYLSKHAVDPDKRRYLVPQEAAHHFIDIDHYGTYPFDSLPRKWEIAVQKYSTDTLKKYGIVPWWIQVTQKKLTDAFIKNDKEKILKLSAELGHYIADAHVPLHNNSNHNGQQSGQEGIHAFWESRIPELLADKDWNFFIGKAKYIEDPLEFTWKRILESASASDTVLHLEKQLSSIYPTDQKFAYESKKGKMIRQYSSDYSKKYNDLLNGMIERRMRASIFAIASFWYTAWVNAGQPDLE